MKKIALTSLVAVFAATAANAATPYASLKLGYTSNIKPEISSHTAPADPNGFDNEKIEKNFNGFAGSIAGGASFDVAESVAIRGELEYTYANSTYKEDGLKLKLGENLIMANAYADFKTGTEFTPYVGFGLGYDFAKVSGVAALGETDPHPFDTLSLDGFAYGFSAGVTYDINEQFAVDLGAKYIIKSLSGDRNVPKWVGAEELTVDADANAFSVMIGARYAF